MFKMKIRMFTEGLTKFAVGTKEHLAQAASEFPKIFRGLSDYAAVAKELTADTAK